MRDCAIKARAKGYREFGENNRKARLTEATVIEIRHRRQIGERGGALAAEFGVSEQTICDIYKERSWVYLTLGGEISA